MAGSIDITGSKLHLRKAIVGHLATLAPDAAIRGIVESEDVRRNLERFETEDIKASASQTHYRNMFRFALWTTTLGTIIGALILLPLDDWLGKAGKGLIASLQTLAVLATFFSIQWIAWRKPIDNWLQSRATAERLRGDLFRTIIEREPASGGTSELTGQKLALLRAAYIDDQFRFFTSRGKKHSRNASSVNWPRVGAYLLFAIAVLLGSAALIQTIAALGITVGEKAIRYASALVADSGHAARWQLGLGTIASSILAHTSARSLMDQDERNASLYAATASRLDEVMRISYPVVEAKAAKNDIGAVKALFTEVRQVLEAEHQAWILSRPAESPADGKAGELSSLAR